MRDSHLTGQGGWVLMLALTVANGSNFLFHVVVSRLLGPSSYGALGAILGLVLVLSVPVNAVQVAVTQVVAEKAKEDGELALRRPIVVAGGLGLLGLALLAGVAPLLRDFLHLDSSVPAILLGAYLIPLFVGLVPKGVLLGRLRFGVVAVGLLAGALARLVFGIVLVRAGLGVNGAVAGTVLGEAVTCLVLLTPLRAHMGPAGDRAGLAVRLGDAGLSVAAFGGFWIFVGIDTLLARHYLPRIESGYYAAAATAARSALFLPAAVGLVVFPRFAALSGRGPLARKTLCQALGLVTVLGAAAAALILAFPRFFVSILFGGRFTASVSVVGLLAVAGAALGAINVLLYFHLAARSRAAISTWAGSLLAGVLIVAFHGSMHAVAWAMLISTVLLGLFLVTRALRQPSESKLVEGYGTQLWDLREPDLELTLVVPFYNPGPRLKTNLEQLIEVLDQAGTSFEIIAVSDGSTDGSEQIAQSIEHVAVRNVALPLNHGKGAALRVGLGMARGRYVGFIDADGDIPPETLRPFILLMQIYAPDVILGSKRHPMSVVDYPSLRRLYSWTYQQLVRVLFRLDVRDTQTGVKLMRRDVLAAVLPRMVEKRFAFDLELFVVAKRCGFNRVFEAPVQFRERFTSTVSAGAALATLVDTAAIFYRLRVLRFYDQPTTDGLVQLRADTVS